MPAPDRSSLRRRRRALTTPERKDAALAAANRLVSHLCFVRARHLGFYVASDGELDPAPLMMAAAGRGKHCYLPVISDRLMSWRTAPLTFAPYDPYMDDLAVNRFGILEPTWNPHHMTPPAMLDIVFVPLVGFDRKGNRVGMGKGFYDRTLANLHRGFRRPKLIGLAYEFQELDGIDPNPWDVGLDAVATASEWIPVSRGLR
ncbi:MAG TPA: 5-formyltetrahydrofolate cyclo-ligase [Pseudomonadales bacterium]|nr:5-formyltetrahydrofolate cyclo-ligase [Pseudomonadales bacterium]